MAGIVMAACLLAFCSAVLLVGRFELKLGIDVLQTLTFIALVFGSQAIIYAIRQRRHLWGSRPSLWLAVSSAADILIAAILSIQRIAMAPLAGWLVANTLAVAAGFAVIADLVKVPTFRLLGIT
jgi:H+-transporting ATPase